MIICAIVVYFTTGLHFTKYLDPLISIVSAVCLLYLSYPYSEYHTVDLNLLRQMQCMMQLTLSKITF